MGDYLPKYHFYQAVCRLWVSTGVRGICDGTTQVCNWPLKYFDLYSNPWSDNSLITNLFLFCLLQILF